MTQYIEKSALVAEIDGWRDRIKKGIFSIPLTGSDRAFATFEYEILGKIKDFIDTIEVKEVDLKEKATQLSQKYFPDEENIWARSNIEAQKCKSACIEMVEWLKA